MDFNSYQHDAYVAIQDHENNKEEVMHWAIGLGEEAGETLSVIKHKYYGGKADADITHDLVAELGDTLWHIAALCTAHNIRLEDVAKYNLAKLQHRYPQGIFDQGRSESRHKLDQKFRDTTEAKQIIDQIKRRSV